MGQLSLAGLSGAGICTGGWLQPLHSLQKFSGSVHPSIEKLKEGCKSKPPNCLVCNFGCSERGTACLMGGRVPDIPRNQSGVTESQKGLVWKGSPSPSHPKPSSRPDLSNPCPTWPGIPNAFGKKPHCKSHSSSQLCRSKVFQALQDLGREGFLLPLAQNQHFVLGALFILETLLDKLLEGLINCKNLSVFPKQSGC